MRAHRPDMQQDDRVAVDVGHAGGRDDTAGELVRTRPGRQPAAEVDDLADAPLPRVPDGLADEPPVIPHQVAQPRIAVDRVQHGVGHRPVSGKVVLAAEQVVGDASLARPGGVDLAVMERGHLVLSPLLF